MYALNYKELSEIRKNRGAEDTREDFMQDIEGKMKIEMDGGMEGGVGEWGEGWMNGGRDG